VSTSKKSSIKRKPAKKAAPESTRQVSFIAKASLTDRVAAVAKAEDRTVSKVISMLVEEALLARNA
jgi:hypothetical protein